MHSANCLTGALHRNYCPANHRGTSVLGAGRKRTLCSESPLEKHFERIYIGFPFARSSHLKPVRDTAWRCQFADAWLFVGATGRSPTFRENCGRQETRTNKHNAGKMTIGSHKDTKGKGTISGQIEGKGKIQIQHSRLPNFPACGANPFDATKRNQKSPLGAGPFICKRELPQG